MTTRPTIRKLRTVALLALLAGTCGVHGTDAQAAKKVSPCDKAGTKTLKKQAGSRVYTQKGRSSVNGPLLVTWACRYKTGKPRKLGTEYLNDVNDGGVALIRLAGPYVGWVHPFSDEFNDSASLEVMDLRSGKGLVPDPSLSKYENLTVDDTALTARGSFAWTVNLDNKVEEVYTMVSGDYKKVDSGTSTTLPGESLLLEGTTLSWRNGDQTKTLELP